MSTRLPSLLCCCLGTALLTTPSGAQRDAATPVAPAVPNDQNPYKLAPFHADFPVALEYAPRLGLEYDRTRLQMLERLAANLQGNVRREAWLTAQEFFWRAPDDAVEPLIEAMDRAFGDPALGDVVKNCVEAMGRMANERLDAALRRALQHKNPNVQQAAFSALATSGKIETVRALAGAFPRMETRAQGAWLRAVRQRLGTDGVPLLRDVVMGPYPGAVRDLALRETLQLPAASAAEVLRGRWGEAIGEFKAIIAGVLHAAGDAAGTAWLREALVSEDLQVLTVAVRHCAFGDPGPLREGLLRASTHLRPEIRLEVARVLMRVDGDDVADVYEVLAAPEEPWDTRSIALRELTRRGRTGVVSVLLDELPTATGTRLQAVLTQLSASGDTRAAPVLLERFRKSPDGEGRPFLQALAQNASEPAAQALLDVFCGPDRAVGRAASGALTTRNYVPVLLLNLRGVESLVVAAFHGLPADAWQQRAALMPTLAGIAADRTDPQLMAACVEPLRQILFDREALPQMRVLALNLLARRSLTIDDAIRLRNARADESPGLRALFADFLNDSF